MSTASKQGRKLILKGNVVVYSIADKHHTTIQNVTALDPSSLDDAASMAGFAQVTAERAGG